MLYSADSENFEVIIIGGGPAGSTAGALLAEKGRRVLIIEKDQFPRYHVGESLMPFCWFTLNRLGLIEEMERIAYTKKYSVQFVTPDGHQSQPFYFFQHSDHPSSVTWQVERSEFDHMLLNNARKKGAVVRELTRVNRTIKDDSGRVIGVETIGPDRQSRNVFAPITIDCSGRAQVTTAQDGWRIKDPQLNKLAVWTYFRGAKRDPGIDEGNTTVAYVEGRGWFWYIPLKNDVVSVGIVAEKDYLFSDSKDPAEIIAREINRNVWIKDHLSTGEQFGEYWVTSEFSYRSKYCADQGLLLAGDAFAFLDPVFSSGVYLALKSGEMAADAVDASLNQSHSQSEDFEEYGKNLCRGIENMRKIIYAFYDQNFSFGRMLKSYPAQRAKLTDALIGDIFTDDFENLQAALREFVELPADLPHGQARVSSPASC